MTDSRHIRFLVDRIRALNSFGAPRSSRDSFSKIKTKSLTSKGGDEAKYTTCGIWLLASRINHSCIGNCRRAFIGDMQIIRAVRDLEADTELLFAYRPPEVLETYDDVQRSLSTWGFTCGCELCVSRKETPRDALQRRKVLFADLRRVLNGVRQTNVARAKRLLQQIEETYPATGPNFVRLELWDPYFALGQALLSANKPTDAITMIVRSSEALGFRITATLPTRSSKVAEFKVIRWGSANDYTAWAFFHLFMAYEMLAPEVCVAAKRYVRVAYQIVMGEEETLCDEFPQLALV